MMLIKVELNIYLYTHVEINEKAIDLNMTR